MKVKDLILKLQELDEEKEIMINSDYPYINNIEDLGNYYCIYGNDTEK
jgi:hypothetical protein